MGISMVAALLMDPSLMLGAWGATGGGGFRCSPSAHPLALPPPRLFRGRHCDGSQGAQPGAGAVLQPPGEPRAKGQIVVVVGEPAGEDDSLPLAPAPRPAKRGLIRSCRRPPPPPLSLSGHSNHGGGRQQIFPNGSRGFRSPAQIGLRFPRRRSLLPPPIPADTPPTARPAGEAVRRVRCPARSGPAGRPQQRLGKSDAGEGRTRPPSGPGAAPPSAARRHDRHPSRPRRPRRRPPARPPSTLHPALPAARGRGSRWHRSPAAGHPRRLRRRSGARRPQRRQTGSDGGAAEVASRGPEGSLPSPHGGSRAGDAAAAQPAGLPAGLQPDDGALLPALRGRPQLPRPDPPRGGLPGRLRREAGALQPPPDGRLRAADALSGPAQDRRLRGRRTRPRATRRPPGARRLLTRLRSPAPPPRCPFWEERPEAPKSALAAPGSPEERRSPWSDVLSCGGEAAAAAGGRLKGGRLGAETGFPRPG